MPCCVSNTNFQTFLSLDPIPGSWLAISAACSSCNWPAPNLFWAQLAPLAMMHTHNPSTNFHNETHLKNGTLSISYKYRCIFHSSWHYFQRTRNMDVCGILLFFTRSHRKLWSRYDFILIVTVTDSIRKDFVLHLYTVLCCQKTHCNFSRTSDLFLMTRGFYVYSASKQMYWSCYPFTCFVVFHEMGEDLNTFWH